MWHVISIAVIIVIGISIISIKECSAVVVKKLRKAFKMFTK